MVAKGGRELMWSRIDKTPFLSVFTPLISNSHQFIDNINNPKLEQYLFEFQILAWR